MIPKEAIMIFHKNNIAKLGRIRYYCSVRFLATNVRNDTKVYAMIFMQENVQQQDFCKIGLFYELA